MGDIRSAGVDDHPALVETLAQAFQTDPALSWILPDPVHRARALRSLFRVLVPADVRAGVALRAPGDEASAQWRAPGRAHSAMGEFLRTVIPLVATFGTALPRGLTVQGGIDAHRPKGRFWYLHYVGVREIARRIGRDPGTISRELRRNAATRSGTQVYRAGVAQWKAQQAAKRPKTAKLVDNDRLREYVQERLSGAVRRPDGTAVAGPDTPAWKGLNKPHRQDRRWATAWSPQQISHRLKVDFPGLQAYNDSLSVNVFSKILNEKS